MPHRRTLSQRFLPRKHPSQPILSKSLLPLPLPLLLPLGELFLLLVDHRLPTSRLHRLPLLQSHPPLHLPRLHLLESPRLPKLLCSHPPSPPRSDLPILPNPLHGPSKTTRKSKLHLDLLYERFKRQKPRLLKLETRPLPNSEPTMRSHLLLPLPMKTSSLPCLEVSPPKTQRLLRYLRHPSIRPLHPRGELVIPPDPRRR